MIFCNHWTNNSFTLCPPPPGSVLAWRGAPLPEALDYLLEDLEAQAHEHGCTIVWDDIADLLQAYSVTAAFEEQLRSAIERIFAQVPREHVIDVLCLRDGASWELVISFFEGRGCTEVRQALQGREPRKARRLSPKVALSDGDRERFVLIQRVVRERVAILRDTRMALIETATRDNWPETKLRSALASRKIDTYAVADGLDLSGDYLTAWLRTRGLPNTHALVREERLCLAARLVEAGDTSHSVAQQIGFSDVDYFKRLLAEHRRSRPPDTSI